MYLYLCKRICRVKYVYRFVYLTVYRYIHTGMYIYVYVGAA